MVKESLELCRSTWQQLAKVSPVNSSFLNDNCYSAFQEFIDSYPKTAFDRENSVGHFTGSALLTNSDYSQVLLTFHSKLHKWLQLGGHADNDPMLDRVAEREVCEESGLPRVSRLCWGGVKGAFFPFDFDQHRIPANPKDPEHFHFDVRYLFVTDEPQNIQRSEESQDLRWFTWEEAQKVTSEESTLRQIEKVLYLRRNGFLFRHLEPVH